MREFAIRIVLLLLFFGALPGIAQNSQPMPRIEGESLNGQKVVLPDAVSGKAAILILGFTKASKTQCGAWADKLYRDSFKHEGVEVYQLPVLEQVPRFVRGMVISGIKKGTAENRRDNFVPILQNESELKRLVAYKEEADAYVIVLDPAGKIVDQFHGPPSEPAYSKLSSDIDALVHRH